MTALFVRVLNMSITASVVVLVMLLIRGLLQKRLPPGYCYLLQGVVFFRLLVPFSVPSAVSLFNLLEPPAPPQGAYVVTMDYLEGAQGYVPLQVTDNRRLLTVLATVWLLVAVLLVLYGAATYGLSLLRVRTAFTVHCDELLRSCKERCGYHGSLRVCRSGAFDTPVVMGLFHPRIILPKFMDTDNRKMMLHILTHELVHIRRHDHVTKVIVTLALLLHWFNPLVWVVYFLFGRDIESSCDEKVLSLLGEQEKDGYAASLVALCAAQHRVSFHTLAFAESNIKSRVAGALDYHPLSHGKMVLLSLFVLLVGLVTSTNPVVLADGYIPARHAVSAQAANRFEQAVPALTAALEQGSPRKLLALTTRSDPYYLSLYQELQQSPIVVQEYKLYPQSDTLCYCYLRTADQREYTAVLTQQAGAVLLERLTPSQTFEATMGVEPTEQVRFVKNLHRFGITTGFAQPQTLPRPAVASLCIDEEYRDRVKNGELAPEEHYLPPAWVAQAAQDYFGLENFSYTFDDELYDSTRQCYRYDPDRGVRIEAAVVAQRPEGEFTLVTAQFYRDPLHLLVEKTITYRLRKK
ncbi:MAG: M56 family metallopeptidase [Angelakisella sp.]